MKFLTFQVRPLLEREVQLKFKTFLKFTNHKQYNFSTFTQNLSGFIQFNLFCPVAAILLS